MERSVAESGEGVGAHAAERDGDPPKAGPEAKTGD